MSDDHLLEIHNQVFPERKKSTKNLKVITKKWPKDYVPYYVPVQKVLYSVISWIGTDNRRPYNFRLFIYFFNSAWAAANLAIGTL